MRRRIAIVALLGLALAMQGCANSATTSPSYLGFSAAAAGDDDEPLPPQPGPAKAARHVSSNKVLGAMAFQKVTGREVDPSRLSGSGR